MKLFRKHHRSWLRTFAPSDLRDPESGIALPTVILLLAITSLIVGSVGSTALAANGVAEAAKAESEATSQANAALDFVRSAIVSGQISTSTLQGVQAAKTNDDDSEHIYRAGTDLLHDLSGITAPDWLSDAHVYATNNTWQNAQDAYEATGTAAPLETDTFTLSLISEATVTSTALSMRTRDPVTNATTADIVVQPSRGDTTVDCTSDPTLFGCVNGEDTYISRGDTNLINTTFGTRDPNGTGADTANPDVNVYVDGNLDGCMGTDVQGTLTVTGDATLGTKDIIYKGSGRYKTPDLDKMKCNVAQSITVQGNLTVKSPSGLVTEYGSTVNVGGNLYLDGNFNIEGDVKVDGDIISISEGDTEVNYAASVYAGGSIKMAGKFTVGEDLVAKKDVTVVWSRTACTGDNCGYNVKRNVVSLEGSVYATRFLVASGGSIWAKQNVMLRRVTVYGGNVTAQTGWVSLQNLKDGQEVTGSGYTSGYWNNDQVHGDVWAGNGVYYAHSNAYSSRANPTVYGNVYVLNGNVQYGDPYPYIYCDTPENPSICDSDAATHQKFSIPDGGASFIGQTGLGQLQTQSNSVTLVAQNGIHAYNNTSALPYNYWSGSHYGEVTDGTGSSLSSRRSCAATSPSPTNLGWWDSLPACGAAPVVSDVDLGVLHLPDGWDTVTTVEEQKKQPVMTKKYILQESTLATWKKYYFADEKRKDTSNSWYRGATYLGTCTDLAGSLLNAVGSQGWDNTQNVMLIADCDQPLTVDSTTITSTLDRIRQTQDVAIVSDRGFRMLSSGTESTAMNPNHNLYLLVPTDYNDPGSDDYASQTNYCVKPKTDDDGNIVKDATGDTMTQVVYDPTKNPDGHTVFSDTQLSEADGPNGVIKFGGQGDFVFSDEINVYAFTPCTVDLNDNVAFRGSIVAGMTYIRDAVDNRQVWFVPSMDMPAKVINGTGTGLPSNDGKLYAARVQVINRLTKDE